jgi:hypothetical protein
VLTEDRSLADIRIKERDGKWKGITTQDSSAPRLLVGKDGLSLEWADAQNAESTNRPSMPPVPTIPKKRNNPVTFRCVGPDLIVSNTHYTVVLRRQGGVIRELYGADGKLVAKDQDFYGDQEYFKPKEDSRITAGNDVECGLRIENIEGGLKLSFEGQLRGFQRFALMRPPLWFRNEMTFTDAPTFHQKYAFRTEKSFKDKAAFLTSIVQIPSADTFRFLRGNEALTDDAIGQTNKRRGETRGKPAPERAEFLSGGKPQFALSSLRMPAGSDCNVFINGRQFFITLLDGKTAAMDQGKWYEFEADWGSE